MKNTLFAWLLLLVVTVNGQKDFIAKELFPISTYEEVQERLSCLETEVPLNFNERVMIFVDYFAIKNRGYVQNIIDKKELFFPTFSKILAEYDLPDEIKYLSIVESALKPKAVSRANAVGLWQFIASTGRIYDLHGNAFLDDRMNPEKATRAACRFLKDLYRQFNDWELAIAAYNCGAGNVRKAIRKSGGKTKFWEIYWHLPRETRSYLPQYVAITYVFEYMEELGFDPTPKQFMPKTDTILISQHFHFETLANHLNFCLEDLLAMNPEIKRGVLPENTKKYALKLPKDIKDSVVARRAFLYDTARKVAKKKLQYIARNTPRNTHGRKKIIYKVRRGDVLGTIARKYGVRISDIKAWNNIKGTMIRVDQRLNIWVRNSYTSKTKKNYTSPNSKATPQRGISQNYHLVRPGDTLWSISQSNKVSIESLRKVNNLNGDKIRVGDKLTIPPSR